MSRPFWTEFGWSVISSDYGLLKYYSEAYFDSASDSILSILKDPSIGNSIRVQPAIHNARMSIELILKFAVASHRQYLGENFSRGWIKQNLWGHNLDTLLQKTHDIEALINKHAATLFGDQQDTTSRNVRAFVTSLNMLDRNSEISRYPVNNEGELAVLDAHSKRYQAKWIAVGSVVQIDLIGFSQEFEDAFKQLKQLGDKIGFIHYHENDGRSLWPMKLGSRLSGVRMG